MRKNFGAKAFSYPQPVFIIATYNDDGSADAMNAAWGGISDTTELSVCLSEGHRRSRTCCVPARLPSAWVTPSM